MDIFIESLVKRNMKAADYMIVGSIITFGIVGSLVALRIPSIGMGVAAAIIYGAYYFSKIRSIEYECSVTNGDMDIDKIIAQRKRKRMFSGNCKEFEMVARVKSSSHTQDIMNIKNRIEAVSSMQSENAFFIVANYNGSRTVVYFEPTQKMLDAFKVYIPKKIFE